LAAVLAEIYLCNVCSCPDTLRRNGRGQITLCPLLVHTEPHDLKCQCTRRAGDGCADYILLYEYNRGGIGIAALIADCIERLLAAALERVSGCPCAAGCSGCIQLPNCGDYNEGLEKPAAIYLLCRLLGRPCNALPPGGAAAAAASAVSWDAGVGPPAPQPVSARVLDGDTRTRSEARCAICIDRIVEPTTTACGHTFCRKCTISTS
jgi:hypothetical protein